MTDNQQKLYDFLMGVYYGKAPDVPWCGLCSHINLITHEQYDKRKLKEIIQKWSENHKHSKYFPVLDDEYCDDGSIIRYFKYEDQYIGPNGCARRRLAKYLADRVEEFVE